MKKLFKEKCFYIVLALFLVTCGLIWFSNRQYESSKKLIEEVEYYDSLNNYNKIYYSKTFKELKKENKELYDSLKQYKDKIVFIVQFTHEKEYETGKIETKPNIVDSIVFDTIKISETLMAKTYEYNSEPNDTFQYKLNVNSYTEPNWYSLNVRTKNKFTIVNKEEDGINHITIGSSNNGNISNVTVFNKKEKRKFLSRFSVGPSVTAGYDMINKQWGIMAGASVTFDLTK
jgi:hypothetical protein